MVNASIWADHGHRRPRLLNRGSAGACRETSFAATVERIESYGWRARRRTGLSLTAAGAALIIAAALPLGAEASGPKLRAPVWDLGRDFRVAPNQNNPNPDRLGHPRVWSFLESATPAHEPSSYTLLSDFITNRFGFAGLQSWQGTMHVPPDNALPSVSLSTRRDNPVPLGVDWPPRAVLVHPETTELVVVGWRSPIRGTVRVGGGVRDRDDNCGDGIDWSIDRRSTTLASGVIDNGGRQPFAASENASRLRAVRVTRASLLYFVVGPGPNSDFVCDSTELEVTIRQRFQPCLDGRPQLSIARASAVVRYGASAGLTARLTCDGRAVARGTLALHRRLITPNRRGRWYRLGSRTTNPRGGARASDRPPVNVQYQWRLLEQGRLVLHSPTIVLRVAPVVTAHLSARSPRSGANRLVSGNVTPPHPGAAVALQRRHEGTWRTITRAQLTTASRYQLAAPARRRGAQRYRVLRPADAYHAAGTSRTLTASKGATRHPTAKR